MAIYAIINNHQEFILTLIIEEKILQERHSFLIHSVMLRLTMTTVIPTVSNRVSVDNVGTSN